MNGTLAGHAAGTEPLIWRPSPPRHSVAGDGSTREASRVPDVFREGILGDPRAGQSTVHSSAAETRCRPATRERGRLQFSETFEVTHAAEDPREVLRPTALQRAVAGSTAAASAYSWCLQSMSWSFPLGVNKVRWLELSDWALRIPVTKWQLNHLGTEGQIHANAGTRHQISLQSRSMLRAIHLRARSM